jgi:hypothetical protein
VDEQRRRQRRKAALGLGAQKDVFDSYLRCIFGVFADCATRFSFVATVFPASRAKARTRFENERTSSTGAMQALLFGDAALGLGFQRCSNEQRYFMLGHLTWNNLALTRPRIVAWMTDGRAVGDTLLIECSNKDLRYALSTALSPLPGTDVAARPAPSHSKQGYAFMRATNAQCSESAEFHDTSLRAQGGGGDGLMRLVCTWVAQPVIEEQEAVEQVEQVDQAEQEAADTEEDEEEVEQVVVAAAAPPAPATRVVSASMMALMDRIFDE